MTDPQPTSPMPVDELAEAFVHQYYGMYTGEALTHDNFKDRAMIVVDADQLITGISKLLEAHTAQAVKEAEAKGRAAVIVAVKDWADDVDVTWNKLVETELDKIHAIEAQLLPIQSTGGSK